MFNTSEIMKSAWTIYRNMTRTARPTTVAGRRKWFASALASAWLAAKAAAAESVKTVAQRAAERVDEIKAQMHNLDMRPFRVSIIEDRALYVAELAALTVRAL